VKEKEEPRRQTREMKEVSRTCMCEELNATKESNKRELKQKKHDAK